MHFDIIHIGYYPQANVYIYWSTLIFCDASMHFNSYIDLVDNEFHQPSFWKTSNFAFKRVLCGHPYFFLNKINDFVLGLSAISIKMQLSSTLSPMHPEKHTTMYINEYVWCNAGYLMHYYFDNANTIWIFCMISIVSFVYLYSSS